MSNKITVIEDSTEQPIIEWSSYQITGKKTSDDVKIVKETSLGIPQKKVVIKRRGSHQDMGTSGTLNDVEKDLEDNIKRRQSSRFDGDSIPVKERQRMTIQADMASSINFKAKEDVQKKRQNDIQKKIDKLDQKQNKSNNLKLKTQQSTRGDHSEKPRKTADPQGFELLEKNINKKSFKKGNSAETNNLKRGSELVPTLVKENMFGEKQKFQFQEPKKNRWGQISDKITMGNFMGSIMEGNISMTQEQAKAQGINSQVFNEMTHRKNEKPFIIYPENKKKGGWDLFMTLVLIITCIQTPLNIAFEDIDNPSKKSAILDYIIDALFFVDIIVIFNSAYYDDDVELIDDRKSIAIVYIQGWFIVDLLAIIPFDQIINAKDYNNLARVARVGRLYKLVKLTRLFRMLKVVKQKSKLLSYLNDYLKIGFGMERLLFFLIVFMLLSHLASCLWIILATLYNADGSFDDTWLKNFKEYQGQNDKIYITAFYWIISTITTVGYGDISGTNSVERVFCSICMFIGVLAFTIANGSLASIIQNYDATNASYQEKMNILNKAQKEFHLPLDLCIRLKKSMGYEFKKTNQDLNNWVDELPHKLKIEVSVYIYEQRYKDIKFFQNKSQASFISWMCPLLQPQYYGYNQYIYYEGDDIKEVHFMISGDAAFVLPFFKNVSYIQIEKGDHFGVMDIIGSVQEENIDTNEWYSRKQILKRQFTIQAKNDTEVLVLSIKNLYQMQQEFIDAYDELFNRGIKRLRKGWVLKLETIAICRSQLEEETNKQIERQQRQHREDESISLSSISSCQQDHEVKENIWRNHFKIPRQLLQEIDSSSSEEEEESDSQSSFSNSSGTKRGFNKRTILPDIQEDDSNNENYDSLHKTPTGKLNQTPEMAKDVSTKRKQLHKRHSVLFKDEQGNTVPLDKDDLLKADQQHKMKSTEDQEKQGKALLMKLRNQFQVKVDTKLIEMKSDTLGLSDIKKVASAPNQVNAAAKGIWGKIGTLGQLPKIGAGLPQIQEEPQDQPIQNGQMNQLMQMIEKLSKAQDQQQKRFEEQSTQFGEVLSCMKDLQTQVNKIQKDTTNLTKQFDDKEGQL